MKKKNKFFKKFLLTFVIFFLINTNAIAESIADQLTTLNNLYKEGAITKEEFSQAKSIILKTGTTKEKTSEKKKTQEKKKKSEKKKKKSKDVKKIVKEKNFNQDLTKTFMSVEELSKLGKYKKIEKIPVGMFKTSMSSKGQAKKSMEEMYKVFVSNKELMEKYPEKTMKAMGYFEVFYMEKLKDEQKTIEKFKENYPEISKSTKKTMQSLYSLNQARKSMREAIGLTLEDDAEEAVEKFMHMHDFLAKGEKKVTQLTSNEKRLKKASSKFKKEYGSFKKTIELKSENRIDDKTFRKDLNKNIKKVERSLSRLTKIDSKTDDMYKIVSDMFHNSLEILDNCSLNCDRKDLLAVIDSTEFTNSILKDVEKNIIKKKHTQDLSKVNMENLPKKQQETLTLASLGMKRQKELKKVNLQDSVLNLENNNFPVGDYLDEIENTGFEVKSVTMSFDNIEDMKKWKVEDWANSWRGGVPTELKDNDGNLIELTKENIEDLKAQLAMNTLNEMIDTSALEIRDTMNESIKEIAKAVESGGFNLEAWLNQDFSISLDNYVKISVESEIARLGDSLSADTIKLIRQNANFENLTNLTNLQYGTNMTSQEYANYWESAAVEGSTSNWGDITRGVDLLSQVGSFEAASIAKDLGADLQTVADSIALAATAGIATDLEAAAQGLGYGSFAEAVAAYNKQYGTNYTVEEAAAALGN